MNKYNIVQFKCVFKLFNCCTVKWFQLVDLGSCPAIFDEHARVKCSF